MNRASRRTPRLCTNKLRWIVSGDTCMVSLTRKVHQSQPEICCGDHRWASLRATIVRSAGWLDGRQRWGRRARRQATGLNKDADSDHPPKCPSVATTTPRRTNRRSKSCGQRRQLSPALDPAAARAPVAHWFQVARLQRVIAPHPTRHGAVSSWNRGCGRGLSIPCEAQCPIAA